VVFYNHLIEGLHTLWIEPVCPFHSDLVDILLEEPVDPVVTHPLLCQIKNQGTQFCTCHWVPNIVTPSAPLDANLLLCIAEKLLVFIGDRHGFATIVVIGDGGGGEVNFFPSTAK